MSAGIFDTETLDRIRGMSPCEAVEETKRLVWANGGTSSDDFHEAFEALVEQGILTWEQIEDLEH